jgi:hypothetical protein
MSNRQIAARFTIAYASSSSAIWCRIATSMIATGLDEIQGPGDVLQNLVGVMEAGEFSIQVSPW